MKWFRYLCGPSTLLLIAIVVPFVEGSLTESTENLVRFLYGEQWSLPNYCNDTRNLETILQDDIEIEMLYNGSLFETRRPFENIIDDAQIISARSRHKLAVPCSINNWGYANKLLEDQSNRPHENESKCLNEMEKFYIFVSNFLVRNRTTSLSYSASDYDHLRQFNSFGRLQSAPAHNNDLLIGDYDACEQLPHARYCLGTYDKFREDPLTRDHSAPFKVGLCISKSCSPKILRKSPHLMQAVGSIVRQNLLPSLIEPSYELQDVHCPPLKDSLFSKDAKKQDLIAKILIFYAPMVWLFMLIVGTLCGLLGMEGSEFWRNGIKPFDLRANWRSFCKSDHLDARLAGLNGAKVLSMNWLFISHISMTLAPYLRDLSPLRAPTIHGAVILQAQHGVPIFFIISGLLAGLRYLKKRRVSARDMLVTRYLRLVPMYLLIYAFVKKFAHLTNDGPFWDHGVSVQSEARQCMNESWLVPILFLANFTPPFAHCIITGWHIANDFQIFLVLPILFWLYRKSPLVGRVTVIIIFLITHLTHSLIWGTTPSFTFHTAIMEPALFGPRIVLDRASLDYVNPLGRLGTYLIGVLVADLLLAYGNHFNTRQMRRVTFDQGKQSTKQLEKAAGEEEQVLNGSNSLRLAALAEEKQQLSEVRDHHSLANNNISSRHEPKAPNGADCKSRGVRVDGQESLSPRGWLWEKKRARSKYENAISTFKETAVLLFGMQAAYGALFTVNWPQHMKLLLEPYSKPLAYPWVRMNVELGWAICLYYLLRDNGAHNGDGQPKAGARPTGRTTSEMAAGGEVRGDKTKLTDGLADDHDDGYKRRVLKNSHHSQLTTATARPATAGNGQNGDELRTNSSSEYNLSFGGFLLKFRFWNVLVKLNYTLMLVHYSMVRYFIQSQRQLFMFTWTNYFQLATFIVLVTYAICLLIHLAIEMPLMALTKLLMMKITSR